MLKMEADNLPPHDHSSDQTIFIVEKILKKRRRQGSTEYLVKWKNYSTKLVWFWNYIAVMQYLKFHITSWRNQNASRHYSPIISYHEISSCLIMLFFLCSYVSNNNIVKYSRWNTWEPEENILDKRLIFAFEDDTASSARYEILNSFSLYLIG